MGSGKHQIGEYAEAVRLFERSLALLDQLISKSGQSDYSKRPLKNLYGIRLLSLSSSCMEMGDFASAKAHAENALQINRELHGERNVNTISAIVVLAEVLARSGDYGSAEENYVNALELRKQIGEEQRDATASIYIALAELVARRGDNVTARSYYELGDRIIQECVGDHPVGSLAQEGLALLDQRDRRIADATSRLDRSMRIQVKHVTSTLPGLLEKEQLTYLRTRYRSSLNRALSFGLQFGERQDVARASATWLINGKAVAHEALAERARLLLQPQDEVAGKKALQLAAVRSELAQISLRTVGKEGIGAHRDSLAALEKEQDDLVRQLAEFGLIAERRNRWYSLDEVARHLPSKSVLVDIVRLEQFDPESTDLAKRWVGARYVAWITASGKPARVEVVDLGDAGPLDELALRLSALMQQTPRELSTSGPVLAESECRKVLETATAVLLKPILAKVPSAAQLILSPDGALWLIPWSALLTARGAYLIEERAVELVTSARSLVPTGASGSDTEAPVVVADPDYDLTEFATAKPEVSLPTIGFHTVRTSSSLRQLAPATRLPGTAAEARLIVPNIERMSGRAPQVLLRAAASEMAVKRAQRPQVLVLSTHGFFLPDQEVDFGRETSAPFQQIPSDRKPLENPFLRCGLLLAGCNDWNRTDADDDGILTGLEILGMDLQGTSMVVLSACDTGIGDVRNGEGVAGLRQAFQLAGAQSVVASLWSVPDADTSHLMAAFFDQLAQGKSASAALQAAQLERIRAHRVRDGAAHPFFWAAFTLTTKKK